MNTEIVHHLAAFLEAIPSQVKMWDRKVIDHFLHNPKRLQMFVHGDDLTKWEIYSSIRYQALHPQKQT